MLDIVPGGAELGAITAVAGDALAPLAPAWAWASDILILLVPMIIMVLVVQYMGRGPFVSIIGGLYIGYALYSAFPYLNLLPAGTGLMTFGAKFGIYLIFVCVSYIILRRVAASDFIHIGIFGVLVISFVTAGFLIALLYHVFPTREVYTFSPAIDVIFAPKEFFYLWFVAPLLGLFFLTR